MMRAALPVFALAVAAVSVAGCETTSADWRQRYLEKEQDASTLSTQLSEERNAHASAVAQLEEARARMKALEQENGGLKARPAETAAVPVAAPEAAPDTGADETVARLKKEGMDAHVTADGHVAIVLPADINFGAGSKDLSPAGRKALDAVARELEGAFAGASIRIEGHTDADPIKKSKFKDNWELAAERALTVLRYLEEESKVAPERLSAVSRGDTVPVADNKSDKGKAKNRRVEVVVLAPKETALAR
jgi:chemotaxis protein MotB